MISGYPTAGAGGAAFAKYNSAGDMIWENLDADGPSYNLLSHAQMKLDGSNAAYLAASIMTNMAVCKVNSDGTSAWTLTPSGGYATCLDFGTDNSVYASSGTIAKIVQETHTLLNVKAFLQGPHNGNEMNTLLNASENLPPDQPYDAAPWLYSGTESVTSIPNQNVVDWVLVELRETTGGASTATPDKMIARQAGFILKNGTITGLDGVSPMQFDLEVTSNLYVVVLHRNHLGILSADAVTKANGVYTFDFSLANKIYGGSAGSAAVSANIWAMAGGAGNADHQVNNIDKNEIWYLQQGIPGYFLGDFNLSSLVEQNDKIQNWQGNSGKSSQVPN